MRTKLFILALAGIILTASYISMQSTDSMDPTPIPTPHLTTTPLTPPSYNKTLSQRYAAFSKIAYCPLSKVEDWSCTQCKAHNEVDDLHIISNPKRSIFGFAFYDKMLERIVLVWRGSIDQKNIENDLAYEKIAYTCKQCQVHLGFYEAYRSVATQTYTAIQSLLQRYPHAKLTVTGHSLGAALSTIAAIQINKKSPNLATQLHTFGSPRIGNSQLAAYIAKEFPTLFRVIHNHDVFPHLPQLQQNYHHYPFEVLFDAGMTGYEVCDGSGEDPTCSNSYSPNYNRKEHWFYFYNMDQTDC